MPLTLEIPDDILQAIPGSRTDVEARLRIEFACSLYQSELASFGSAARVAGIHPYLFGHELCRHGIPRHYGEEEIHDDAAYVESRQ
jgi:predicted HTH domain antitoxin